MSRRDPLSDQIDKTLRDSSPNHLTCSIFKVPSRLRSVNERAYEPEIISIGPYHRGKDNLKMMEEHKKRYLITLLQRRGETSVVRYVTALRDEEERARQCYDQSVSLGKDEFIKMLLLDGCFIVELIRECNNPGRKDNDDPVTDVPWILSSITTDLLLLENQLPFFVLRELFMMTIMPNQNEDVLSMTFNFFKWMFPVSEFELNNTNSGIVYEHLLDIVYHHNWQQLAHPAWFSVSLCSDSNGQLLRPAKSTTRTDTEENNWEFIRRAKELEEADIEFKKQERSAMLSEGVSFRNGKMLIPPLKIVGTTESLFRNLLAYEQCSKREDLYVTDYITLMDRLIDTQEDVQILRHAGIIESALGNDEMVCTLFNKLGTNVMLSYSNHFYYAKLFESVKEHCKKPRNAWLAKLRHDYFNTPWAWISFLAALTLLLLTFIQTVFTVKSYDKQ